MKKDFCYVFIKKVGDYKDNKILPHFTQCEIERVGNNKVKEQKRAAYGLLRYAIKKFLNRDEDFVSFSKTANGKPVCPDFFFSISHSHDLVAVAISSQSIGIDIEMVDNNKNLANLKSTILCQDEENAKTLSMKELTSFWVKKEAIFKQKGGKTFIPRQINTRDFWTLENSLEYERDVYCWAISMKRNDVLFELNLNVWDFNCDIYSFLQKILLKCWLYNTSVL